MPQESHTPSASDSATDVHKSEDQNPKVLQQNESKGININDFILSFNFVDLNFYHAKFPNGYENVIKDLRDEISRLTYACKDQEKLLQICDDREVKLKEEIINLKINLVELERVEKE